MMVVASRTQDGKPLPEAEMGQVSLTENPRIDRILQQVMARMNQEPEGGKQKKGRGEGISPCFFSGENV